MVYIIIAVCRTGAVLRMLPLTHAHNLNAHGTGEAWNQGYFDPRLDVHIEV